MGHRSSNSKIIPRGAKVDWDHDRTTQSHCQWHYFTPRVSRWGCYFLKESFVCFFFLKHQIFSPLSNANLSFWRELEEQIPSIVTKGMQVAQNSWWQGFKYCSLGKVGFAEASLYMECRPWFLGGRDPLRIRSLLDPGLSDDAMEQTRAVVSKARCHTQRVLSPSDPFEVKKVLNFLPLFLCYQYKTILLLKV